MCTSNPTSMVAFVRIGVAISACVWVSASCRRSQVTGENIRGAVGTEGQVTPTMSKEKAHSVLDRVTPSASEDKSDSELDRLAELVERNSIQNMGASSEVMEQAIASLETFYAENPKSVRAAELLMDALEEMPAFLRPGSAREPVYRNRRSVILSGLLRADPKNTKFLQRSLRHSTRRERLAIYKRLLTLEPNNKRWVSGLATYEMSLGYFDSAAQHMEQLVRAAKSERLVKHLPGVQKLARLEQCRVTHANNGPNPSEVELRHCIDELVELSKGAHNSGSLLVPTRKALADAYGSLETYLEPKSEAWKRARRARQNAFSSFFQANRKDPVVWLDKATMQEKRDSKVYCLDKALALSPNDPEINFRLGTLLVEVNKHHAAIAPLSKAVELAQDLATKGRYQNGLEQAKRTNGSKVPQQQDIEQK